MVKVRILNMKTEGNNYTFCHHFNGRVNERCKVGILYSAVVNDTERSFPCCVERTGSIKCDKFRLSTPEEEAEEEKAIQDSIDRTMKTIPIVKKIKQDHVGEDWKGIVECPICKGKLHLSHASINGHVWGRCETSGCVNWME